MSVAYTEIFNAENLKIILKNKKYFTSLMRKESFEGSDCPFTLCEKYLAKSKNGTVEVKYFQHGGKGRLFAEGSLSLQNLPREIRATVANDLYYDIDMANAHPVLVEYIARVHLDYKCEYLNDYIYNRENKIQNVLDVNPDITRDDVKKVILSVMYGGNTKYNELKNRTKWIESFYGEMRTIFNKLKEKYPKKLEKLAKNKEYNLEGSLLSSLACEYENQLLQVMIEYFTNKKLIKKTAVLCFDGLLLPKGKLTEDKLKVHLAAIEEIFKSRGFEMKLAVKPMTPLPLNNIPVLDEEDDDELLCVSENLNFPISNKNQVKIDGIPIIQEYYKVGDPYYFIDFITELKSKTWDSDFLLRHHFYKNINRVLVLMTDNSIYIKNTADEPFMAVKTVTDFNIQYMDEDENGRDIECSVRFKTVLFGWCVNSVKVFTGFVNKPTDPAEECAENTNTYFNIWSGFTSKLLPKDAIDYGKIEMILNHIKDVWACGDNTHFHYICSWFHSIFKMPYRKTGVAMVFHSKQQGVGKSILVESFLMPYVFGPRLSCCENGIQFATERFNARFMNKLFVCCEELTQLSGSYHGTFDLMKKIITNKTISIEIKGGAKFEIEDYMNLILFTNNDFCLKLEESDRRYYVADCSTVHLGDFDYFKRLQESFNQDVANHFFSYMYHLENPVDVRYIPRTKLKNSMILNNMPNPVRFLHEVHAFLAEDDVQPADELPSWQSDLLELTVYSGSGLYNLYKKYCRDSNEKEVSSQLFGRMISSYIVKRKSNGVIRYNLGDMTL